MFSQNKLMVIFLSTAMAGMAAKGALFPNAVYAARSVDEAKPGNKLPVAEAKDIAVPSTEAKEETHVGVDSETTVAGNAAPDHEVKPVNVPKKVIARSVGNYVTYDYTKKTSEKFLEDAPGAASNDRIAVVLYGGNDSVKGAAQFATEQFALNVHDVSYMEMRDDDINPNTSRIEVWAEGEKVSGFLIGNNASQKDIARAIYKKMMEGHELHIAPYYADNAEKQETKDKEGGE
ncbi:MAG: hypothetical protein GY789_27840 [Hyphomicrobiales bacterium]|nr:hypothetical protein [Hyphomicrobiales bacterium]